MGGLDGIQHGDLVHLVGAGLDHDDLLLGGGNGELQVADIALLQSGVDHQLAVHQTHEHAGDGAVPGNVGDGQGDGGADHAGDLRAAVLVHAHDGHDNRHVVAHVLGEQGPDGTVHHTAGQDGLFAGAALTAHKAAGDAAHSVQLLLKVHAQREEVDAVAGLLAHGHVAQHNGLAVAHQAAAVGQTAHLAGLNHQRTAGQFHFEGFEIGEFLMLGCKFQSHSVTS